ncbi:MAG TPA: cytochrome c-type biogenesis protein CcmH [Solirubrobacterales bacterium]|nr:cytochrome c-type biogenesis protein CcmH [Solirubrobacterales bacterium]
MRAAATALVLVVAAIAAAPAPAAEPRASLTDIEDEVMCPICGTPLNLAAAPQAERQRAFIRRLLAEGRTKEEIKDALVREYGPEVLATPEGGGFDLAAWLVPGAGLLLAALALAIGVRRWRRRPGAEPGDDDAAEPDADDSERLRSDLARYDL